MSSAAPEFCGGEAKPGAIGAYFHRLAGHLASSDQAVPMTFYAERFGVRSDGVRRVFPRPEMGDGARALPSLEDWREISRRGPRELESAGYRGCFLAHGKVWFETDGDVVALTSFDKDMPWD